ncbi:MAG TPA: helix-turn-helix domain-containing protein [Blastocatellia bacterium]|nr:helix-turn-helix domain-containing protein [Blastocatellia bacterium]
MANTGETAATIAREREPGSFESEIPQQINTDAPRPIAHQEQMPEGFEQAKTDVSHQDASELLPKLMSYFHNSREELARALGVHRSTVDRWLNHTSRPNNSTLLRMRRLAQERHIH